MIELHSHTLLSDGELLPSEMVRRAAVKGYKAIALTDHVDVSNIDFVLPRIIKVCKTLNKNWRIISIPGVEITHAPLEEIKPLVKFARRHGAKVVIVHGETIAEPVIPGTNRRAIEAGCDILAHPGMIEREDVLLAKKKNVYLEITTRKNHRAANRHVYKAAKNIGANLVLDNDSHSDEDLVKKAQAITLLKSLGMNQAEIRNVFANSEYIIGKATKS